MNISLRSNVHAGEARRPYWSRVGAGRTPITMHPRKLQTYAKTHVVENVHAFTAKSPFGGNRAPGERQSRRYADLFFVALKGLAGATLANQGRSHEARGLLRDGQRSANHHVRLSFTKTIKITCFEKVHAVEANNSFW